MQQLESAKNSLQIRRKTFCLEVRKKSFSFMVFWAGKIFLRILGVGQVRIVKLKNTFLSLILVVRAKYRLKKFHYPAIFFVRPRIEGLKYPCQYQNGSILRGK